MYGLPKRVIILSLVALAGGCGQTEKVAPVASSPAAAPAEPTIAIPPLDATQPASYPGLHNVVTYAPGLFEGSVPEGESGFATLQAMGVATIISVDGAAPDVEAAKAHGLRYIHLPIGYNGMDERRTLEIARAIQVSQEKNPDAPVYVHCHHGKHRSAGALAAAAVTLGYMTPEQGVAKMKVSGTAPNYAGLYRCVEVAEPAAAQTLKDVPAKFPEVWRSSGLVQTMVEIDEVFDHLKAIQGADWKAPADHPDLVPVAEAGRLADLFRNLRDDEHVKSRPAEFSARLMKDSEAAQAIEEQLAGPSPSTEQLGRQFKLIAASCKECHARFRDQAPPARLTMGW